MVDCGWKGLPTTDREARMIRSAIGLEKLDE